MKIQTKKICFYIWFGKLFRAVLFVLVGFFLSSVQCSNMHAILYKFEFDLIQCNIDICAVRQTIFWICLLFEFIWLKQREIKKRVFRFQWILDDSRCSVACLPMESLAKDVRTNPINRINAAFNSKQCIEIRSHILASMNV